MSNKISFLEGARPYKSGEAFELIKEWVPFYSVAIMLGMLLAILTVALFWKRAKLNFDHLFIIIFITIPSSIIGARLGFIFEKISAGQINDIKDNWWNIRSGGLSIQWGVILAATLDLVYIYFKRDKIDYRQALSIILPTILIGQAIGRWGNYTNHEVYGKIDETGESVLWLGETITRNMFISDAIAPDGAVRIPLFFYEFLTSLIGYILIVWVLNVFNWLKPGVTGGFYLIWYGLVRASMEFLREEAYVIYFVIAIIFILVGITMAVYFQLFGNFQYKFENKKLTIIKKQRYEKTQEKYFDKISWTNWVRIEENIIPRKSKVKQETNLGE